MSYVLPENYKPILTKLELKEKIIQKKEQNSKRLAGRCSPFKADIYYYTAKFKNASTGERVFVIINDVEERPVCPICKKTITNFRTKGYNKFCSHKCSANSVETQNKYKSTCMSKYGVENSSKSPIIQEKQKQKCLKKYNVPHAMQNSDVKEKRKRTCLEKYGVENVYQSEEIKEKIKQKFLFKYGVERPMQNSEVFNNSIKKMYSTKKYTFPSGRIEYVQGYESQVLDELINHFDENDIVCGKGLPTIWYEFEEKKKKYYPDIYIKSRNLIIEVKSIYTYYANFEINQAKADACKEQEYNFLFIIGK